MARFPKIQSPCPYKSNLAAVMDGDMCRMCNRQVFDLSAMDDGDRVAFLSGCTEEVCVSYRLPLRPAIAAAALAAAAAIAPMSAAAQDYEMEITVGGIRDVKNIDYVEDAADAAIPELPVVYDETVEQQATVPTAAHGAG